METSISKVLNSVVATLSVRRISLSSFKEIAEKMKLFNFDINFMSKQKREVVDFFLRSGNLPSEELEVVLYWEGYNQEIPNHEMTEEYFNSRGFCFIKDLHPGILVDCMQQLSEEELFKLGIPQETDIVLISNKENLFPNNSSSGNKPSFVIINRRKGIREIDFLEYNSDLFDYTNAFILQIKK